MTTKTTKWLPEKEFRYIYSKVPRLCVEVVVKNGNGVVLSKRDIPPAEGKWHIPGGTVRFGETLYEAINRVAKEEVGLIVEVKELLDVIDYSKNNIFGHTVGVAFLVDIKSGRLRGSDQAKDVRFFKKIPQNTIIEQKKFLKRAFGMK